MIADNFITNEILRLLILFGCLRPGKVVFQLIVCLGCLGEGEVF